MEFLKESHKNIEVGLQQKIDLAKNNSLSREEYEYIQKKESELQDIQNQRELTDEEVDYFYGFREKMNKATIRVETLPEAKRVMEILGFGRHSLIDTLSHENAHGNKASQLGANHLGYKFCLIKAEDGSFYIQPQAIINLPENWDNKTKKEVLSEIILAPEEYSNKISTGDRQDLDQLSK